MAEYKVYNQIVQHIHLLLKVLDIAKERGLDNPKDRLIYRDSTGQKTRIMSCTIEEIEKLLKLDIKMVIRCNKSIKEDFFRECKYLSQDEKDSILLIKKNN